MNRVTPHSMTREIPFRTFLRALTAGTLLVTMPSWAEAEERVLLDFNMKTLAPGDWTMEGYAFGLKPRNAYCSIST